MSLWKLARSIFKPEVLSHSRTSSSPRSAVDKSKMKILQGNDDGWAEANLRATCQVLGKAGYQSMISSPTENKSGIGPLSKEPTSLVEAGQYNSIPPGAPPIGQDLDDDHIWYVNAFPVDGIRYALDSLVDKYLGDQPSLVVTGPNVGKNVNFMNYFSGTVGAASYAASRGIPAIAISVDEDERHSYSELNPADSSYIYAEAVLRVVDALVQGGTDTAYLPPDCILNINLQGAGPNKNTQAASDYKFVLTSPHPFYLDEDVEQCGGTRLETESEVLERDSGSWASISVMHSKRRANESEQEHVASRLKDLLSCS